MIILAMDTALGDCSVALWQGDKVTHSLHADKNGSQSARLLPMVEEVLTSAAIGYGDCDAIACTLGPGGFTGIRVGLSAARALKTVTGKPLIGLTTLEVIAFALGVHGDILSVIDAYRGQYYVQRFRRNAALRPLSDPMLVDAHMIEPLAHGAKIAQILPQAGHVAELAYVKWQKGEREFPSSPVYIREPDAKISASV